MAKRLSKFTEFNLDDFFGIQNGQGSDFTHTIKPTSPTSYEISEFGPCMNPGGYVSNVDCPDLNKPYCNCPNQHLMPKGFGGKEPTENELLSLLKKTNECDKIKTVLSADKWFGIDYSNPNCSYNCFSEISDNGSQSGISSGYKELSEFNRTTTEPDAGEEDNYRFPYSERKSYTDEDTGKIMSFVGITGSTGPDDPDDPTNPGETSNTDKLNNFKDYLAYSRTNATFWNTPPKTPLLRKAQTALLTYQRISIMVNGHFDIRPGNTIKLNIPTGEAKSISETRFSGKWMIYKIERIITTQKHSMILSLMRDGNAKDPDTTTSVDTSKTG